MAFATLAASSVLATPSYATDRHSLSCSSSPFLESSTLRFVPLKCRVARAAVSSPKCGLISEEEVPSKSTARRNVLAGIIATGAALAVFTNASLTNVSLAFVGPGSNGAEQTAQKADELLKSADKLNLQDAPKRFGFGASGSAQDAANVAQNAGSGAVSDLQAGIKSIFGQGQDKKAEIEKGAKDVVGQTQSSGGGLLDTLQDRVQGVKEGVTSKNADAKNALEQAESAAKDVVQ